MLHHWRFGCIRSIENILLYKENQLYLEATNFCFCILNPSFPKIVFPRIEIHQQSFFVQKKQFWKLNKVILLIYTWWPDGKIRSCGKPSEETSPEFWNRLSISESCYRQGEVENEGTEGVLMYSKSSSPQPEKCVWFREKYHHSLSSRRSFDVESGYSDWQLEWQVQNEQNNKNVSTSQNIHAFAKEEHLTLWLWHRTLP